MDCIKLSKREAYQKDLDRQRALSRERNRRYREVSSDKFKATQDRWRENNPERRSEIIRDSYYKDVEASRMKHRLWRLNNSEHFRDYHKERYYKNLGVSREDGRVKYKRKIKAGILFRSDLRRVFSDNRNRNGGRLVCYLCGKEIIGESGNIEHKTPIIRGGSNTLGNLDIAHGNCNKIKGSKTHSEWLGGQYEVLSSQ